jgi:hypothetical protein
MYWVSGEASARLPPRADERLHPAIMHRLRRVHDAESVLARRIDVAHLRKPVKELLIRALIDPERAVALHAAMPAHRARPRLALTLPPGLVSWHHKKHVMSVRQARCEAWSCP